MGSTSEFAETIPVVLGRSDAGVSTWLSTWAKSGWAASDWTGGARSEDYPGYDKIIAGLAEQDFDSQVASGSAWVGTPDAILQQIRDYDEQVGGFEHASLQVNFNTIGRDDADASMRLFAREVIPCFDRSRPQR